MVRRPVLHAVFTICAVALVAGCSVDETGTTSSPGTGASATQPQAAVALEEASSATSLGAAVDAGSMCGPFDGVAFTDGRKASAVDLGGDGVGVRGLIYPRPEYEGNPWSHWGQGAVTSEGRYFSAIGDHLGADGNSYLYEFDPGTGVITEVANVAATIDPPPGDWGHGKVHGQMVQGPCGEIYAASYWGSRRGIERAEYRGGALIRIDPVARTVADLGVPIPAHGIPSLASWPAGGIVYGEAADPTAPQGSNRGPFFAYDIETGEVVYSNDDPSHQGFRSIAVDAQGRALVGFGEGRLSRFDPVDASLEPFATMPGSRLRAVTPPAPDGTLYAVSERPDVFFAIRPDGSTEELGPAPGYTTSLAMEPDGSVVYSVPGAHGDGYDLGLPLIALDTVTGEQRVLVELAPLIEAGLGVRGGGTYAISLDAEHRRLFITVNAGRPDARDPFGEVVLVEVTLP